MLVWEGRLDALESNTNQDTQSDRFSLDVACQSYLGSHPVLGFRHHLIHQDIGQPI